MIVNDDCEWWLWMMTVNDDCEWWLWTINEWWMTTDWLNDCEKSLETWQCLLQDSFIQTLSDRKSTEIQSDACSSKVQNRFDCWSGLCNLLWPHARVCMCGNACAREHSMYTNVSCVCKLWFPVSQCFRPIQTEYVRAQISLRIFQKVSLLRAPTLWKTSNLSVWAIYGRIYGEYVSRTGH